MGRYAMVSQCLKDPSGEIIVDLIKTFADILGDGHVRADILLRGKYRYRERKRGHVKKKYWQDLNRLFLKVRCSIDRARVVVLVEGRLEGTIPSVAGARGLIATG